VNGHSDLTERLAQALVEVPDWEDCADTQVGALQAAAIDHGIEALLWETLAGATGTAASLRAALEPRVRAAATRDLFIQRDLQNVVAGLDAAGVPVLITKGTALAYTVYARPWLRPRSDSDLLVRHDDVAAATTSLERCGYTRSNAISTGALVSHQIAFERTDPHGVHHVVDLHWKIVNPQVVADALSFDELWREAQPAPLLGPAARVPSPVGSIALGCVHRLAHHQGHDRLIWLYDLKLLTATLAAGQWMALQELACAHRIAGLCLDGLRSARSRLRSALPDDVERALAAAAPHEPSRVYLEGHVTRRDVLLSDLGLLRSWRDRVRLLCEHAFPPAAFMLQRYGTRARWLLPALYAHRLATGGSRWMRH